MEDFVFYKNRGVRLLCGDCLVLMPKLPSHFFDMIFIDPPYFLSDNGISNSNGRIVCVNKGNWDKSMPLQQKYQFYLKLIKEAKRVLHTDGTMWITGTHHNIYLIGYILELEGFKIMNHITWKKLNPPRNLSERYFIHSAEYIIWAKKEKTSKHRYNHHLMAQIFGKEATDVWEGPIISKKEKRFGYHPTQKPEYLLRNIILSCTNENSIILDPFLGSGTTTTVAKRYNRRCIGIEKEKQYLQIAKRRWEAEHEKKF